MPVSDIDRVFDLTPDELNAAFRTHAPKLASRALTEAITFYALLMAFVAYGRLVLKPIG